MGERARNFTPMNERQPEDLAAYIMVENNDHIKLDLPTIASFSEMSEGSQTENHGFLSTHRNKRGGGTRTKTAASAMANFVDHLGDKQESSVDDELSLGNDDNPNLPIAHLNEVNSQRSIPVSVNHVKFGAVDNSLRALSRQSAVLLPAGAIEQTNQSIPDEI